MSHTQEWLKQFGSSNTDYPITMVIGSDNSIFITGYTDGDVDGQGAGTYAGGNDLFVAKYDANGEQKWLKQIGTSNTDYPITMLIGSDNSIFIMGKTSGDVDGTGAGTYAGTDDVFVAKYNTNGTQEWLKQFGSDRYDSPTTMLIGSDNSIFIMGYTGGDIDGAGAGTYTGSGNDVFVAKYNAEGTQIWLKQFGSSSYDEPTTMVIGSDNSIFIMGKTSGDVDGTGAGTYTGSGNDVFIAKYNTNGTQEWLKQFGTSSYDISTTMLIGSDNSIFIMGFTSGDIDGQGAGTYAGGNDVFVAKYDANGEQKWLKQIGTSSTDEPTTMLIGSDNSIFIMGFTSGDVDGQGAGTYAGGNDVFVAKYDANGEQKWLKQIGTSSTDEPTTMLIGSYNSIFITGYTYGDIDGAGAGNTSADVFVAKYDANGEQIWLKQFGSSIYDSPTTMLIGSDNSIFITGYTYGDIDGQGAGTYAGSADVFVAKYDANGEQIWLKQFGSSNSDIPKTMLIGSYNSIFITGYTLGNLGGTNAGGIDAFITKYNETTNSETTLVGFRYSSNMIFSTNELHSFKPTMFSSEDAYSMSWKISPKQLPAGIEFNKRTGKIIGTPTMKFDEQTFTVFATSSDNISARYAFKMKCE